MLLQLLRFFFSLSSKHFSLSSKHFCFRPSTFVSPAGSRVRAMCWSPQFPVGALRLAHCCPRRSCAPGHCVWLLVPYLAHVDENRQILHAGLTHSGRRRCAVASGRVRCQVVHMGCGVCDACMIHQAMSRLVSRRHLFCCGLRPHCPHRYASMRCCESSTEMFQWAWESLVPLAHPLPMLLRLLAGSHGYGEQVLARLLRCPCLWLGLRVSASQSDKCGDPCPYCMRTQSRPRPCQGPRSRAMAGVLHWSWRWLVGAHPHSATGAVGCLWSAGVL